MAVNRNKRLTLLSCQVLCLVFTLPGYADINDNRDTSTNVIDKEQKYPSPVPDTGQIRCYDNSKGIPCPSPTEPFYGQDAHYTVNQPKYTSKQIDGTRVVIDQVTGLIWQTKKEDTGRTWSEAIDYADNLSPSGPHIWRLPEKQELQSIINYGISTPFPIESVTGNDSAVTLEGEDCVWSLTTRIFPSLVAMALCFNDNQVTISNKYEKKNALAVSGPPKKYGKFMENGNATVTDENTGLMWQSTETRAENWQQALSYCQTLDLAGFNDWRLPSIRELSTLVNDSRTNPSIDTIFFPGCRPGPYWSSTTYTQHPGFAWYVGFDDGLERNGGYKGRRYFIRAVRGGEISMDIPQSPPMDIQSLESKPARQKIEPPELKPTPAPTEEMDRLEPYPLGLDDAYENNNP